MSLIKSGSLCLLIFRNIHPSKCWIIVNYDFLVVFKCWNVVFEWYYKSQQYKLYSKRTGSDLLHELLKGWQNLSAVWLCCVRNASFCPLVLREEKSWIWLCVNLSRPSPLFATLLLCMSVYGRNFLVTSMISC